MASKIRLIVIILIVLLAVTAFIAYQNYTKKQEVERENSRLSEENDQLTGKVGKLESSIRQNESKIKGLTDELTKLTAEKNDLQKKYDAARKSQDDLVDQLREQKAISAGVATRAELETQLNKLRGDLRSLEARKEQLQREKESLSQDVNALKSSQEELKRQPEARPEPEVSAEPENNVQEKSVSSGSEGSFVELPPIIVRPKDNSLASVEVLKPGIDQKKMATTPSAQANTRVRRGGLIEGKILAVIRDNNFVVIDQGEDSGIDTGQTFGVYRKEKKIATISAIRIAKNVSACDIKEESKPILVGDEVK